MDSIIEMKEEELKKYSAKMTIDNFLNSIGVDISKWYFVEANLLEWDNKPISLNICYHNNKIKDVSFILDLRCFEEEWEIIDFSISYDSI